MRGAGTGNGSDVPAPGAEAANGAREFRAADSVACEASQVGSCRRGVLAHTAYIGPSAKPRNAKRCRLLGGWFWRGLVALGCVRGLLGQPESHPVSASVDDRPSRPGTAQHVRQLIGAEVSVGVSAQVREDHRLQLSGRQRVMRGPAAGTSCCGCATAASGPAPSCRHDRDPVLGELTRSSSRSPAGTAWSDGGRVLTTRYPLSRSMRTTRTASGMTATARSWHKRLGGPAAVEGEDGAGAPARVRTTVGAARASLGGVVAVGAVGEGARLLVWVIRKDSFRCGEARVEVGGRPRRAAKGCWRSGWRLAATAYRRAAAFAARQPVLRCSGHRYQTNGGTPGSVGVRRLTRGRVTARRPRFAGRAVRPPP